jgi:hypothetical protein
VTTSSVERWDERAAFSDAVARRSSRQLQSSSQVAQVGKQVSPQVATHVPSKQVIPSPHVMGQVWSHVFSQVKKQVFWTHVSPHVSMHVAPQVGTQESGHVFRQVSGQVSWQVLPQVSPRHVSPSHVSPPQVWQVSSAHVSHVAQVSAQVSWRQVSQVAQVPPQVSQVAQVSAQVWKQVSEQVLKHVWPAHVSSVSHATAVPWMATAHSPAVSPAPATCLIAGHADF